MAVTSEVAVPSSLMMVLLIWSKASEICISRFCENCWEKTKPAIARKTVNATKMKDVNTIKVFAVEIPSNASLDHKGFAHAIKAQDRNPPQNPMSNIMADLARIEPHLLYDIFGFGWLLSAILFYRNGLCETNYVSVFPNRRSKLKAPLAGRRMSFHIYAANQQHIPSARGGRNVTVWKRLGRIRPNSACYMTTAISQCNRNRPL